MSTFDSREVQHAHDRLKQAYHPHPVSLLMISNILHDRGDALATQVDIVIETLGTKPLSRENWIFIITDSRPRDPFSVLQDSADVVENLSCVDLRLEGLTAFVKEIFDNPLPKPARS